MYTYFIIVYYLHTVVKMPTCFPSCGNNNLPSMLVGLQKRSCGNEDVHRLRLH